MVTVMTYDQQIKAALTPKPTQPGQKFPTPCRIKNVETHRLGTAIAYDPADKTYLVDCYPFPNNWWPEGSLRAFPPTNERTE